MTSNRHFLSFLLVMFLLLEVTFAFVSPTIFGKSHDLKTKTPKTQAAYKSQRVECIQIHMDLLRFALP